METIVDVTRCDNCPLEASSGGYILEVTGSSGRCSTQFDLGDESRYLGVMTLAAT